MQTLLSKLESGLKRIGYLLKATALACVLGVIEMVQTQRGRRVLGGLTLVAVVVGALVTRPIRSVPPGEAAVRVNRLTGGVTVLDEGWIVVVPGVHEFRRYPLHDQVYRPADAAHASGTGAFQSVEGLSLGIDVSVRWALDPERMSQAARLRPEQIGAELVVPTVDGALHGAFAQHTVREIFATQRGAIQKALEDDLRAALVKDGVIVKAVVIGSIDLPEKYKAGLEALLSEELAAEKMRYTLELKEKAIKQTELEAEADKVRREKAAEAAGAEQVIAAKSQEEAMAHVLPLKEKEIDQKRLEAEAAKVTRLKAAEANAEARRIEAGGEADSRRKLADSDAYRLEVTGKASSEQMAREAALLAKNPLLIQKTLADKLSDKISVIIAPPNAGGFFAGNLLGGGATAGSTPTRPAKPDDEEQ
ncbi:MAG TPA: SPFH domain-containing protein [Kofleriaceae bacterium]|jgi:regulator of protease activity HflC (stomatin/prohibitin superfamily)|nr:SPFH domain-containing protein [Kofleriaceae bacterium]